MFYMKESQAPQCIYPDSEKDGFGFPDVFWNDCAKCSREHLPRSVTFKIELLSVVGATFVWRYPKKMASKLQKIDLTVRAIFL